MMTPWYSSGASMTSSSIGSSLTPPSSFVTISGRDTWIS